MYMGFKFDKSLIKGKDLGLFNQVVEYLGLFDLKVKIGGGVINNAIQGNPRNYKNIDLIIELDESKNRNNALYSLLFALYDKKGLERDSSTIGPIFANKIKDSNIKNQNYIDTTVDNKFTIYDPRTNTTIDLCFEANPTLKLLL